MVWFSAKSPEHRYEYRSEARWRREQGVEQILGPAVPGILCPECGPSATLFQHFGGVVGDLADFALDGEALRFLSPAEWYGNRARWASALQLRAEDVWPGMEVTLRGRALAAALPDLMFPSYNGPLWAGPRLRDAVLQSGLAGAAFEPVEVPGHRVWQLRPLGEAWTEGESSETMLRCEVCLFRRAGPICKLPFRTHEGDFMTLNGDLNSVVVSEPAAELLRSFGKLRLLPVE